MIYKNRIYVCFIFCVVILSACVTKTSTDKETNKEKNYSDVEAEPNSERLSEATEVQDIPEEEFIRLSNNNVKEFLTQFATQNNSNRIKITTPQGEIEAVLYDDTPLHRASFIHLIEEKYFHFVEITRVKKNFVVQGGNSQEEAKATQRFLLGNYTIPAEITPYYYHKKGALAMARDIEDNPEKRSSPYDFYIVHGRKAGGAELYNLQKEKSFTYSDKQKQAYKTTGGTPHLDRDFTVFGEVTKGLNVLDKIANLPVDGKDWPKDDLIISIEILN